MTDGVQVTIDVDGIRQTVLALSAVDKKFTTRLRREVRKAGADMTDDAASAAPVGKTGRMRKGYRIFTRITKRNAVGFIFTNTTKQDAILGWAGSASRGKPGQGKSLIAGLEQRHGKAEKDRSRFMWPAYERHKDALAKRIEQVVQQVDTELEEELRRGR